MPELLWKPSAADAERSNLTAFMRAAERRHNRGPFAGYPELYRWSIDQPREFWQSIWEFGDVKAEQTADEVVRHFDRMPGAEWFPSARLNFARNLLRYGEMMGRLRERRQTNPRFRRWVVGLESARRAPTANTAGNVNASAKPGYGKLRTRCWHRGALAPRTSSLCCTCKCREPHENGNGHSEFAQDIVIYRYTKSRCRIFKIPGQAVKGKGLHRHGSLH
ncbi:MAG: hypothetical protein IIB62_04310 [Proteobacteria bacterium]|nr:hypothetical protein [Pseudomonadota bacterium]